MEYRLPTLGDEADLQDYLRECADHGEHDVLQAQELFVGDYPTWVSQIERNAHEGNGDWGRSLLLLCRDNGGLVGILCVRHELSDELKAIYGNIGYSVRPTKRCRGYATRMLRHALAICADSGLGSVALGCYKDNAASASVIKKCGGFLTDENDNYTKGRTSQYYEISLR